MAEKASFLQYIQSMKFPLALSTLERKRPLSKIKPNAKLLQPIAKLSSPNFIAGNLPYLNENYNAIIFCKKAISQL